MNVCWQDICNNRRMLQLYNGNILSLSGSLLAYCKYAGEEGRSMPGHWNA